MQLEQPRMRYLVWVTGQTEESMPIMGLVPARELLPTSDPERGRVFLVRGG